MLFTIFVELFSRKDDKIMYEIESLYEFFLIKNQQKTNIYLNQTDDPLVSDLRPNQPNLQIVCFRPKTLTFQTDFVS